MIHFALSLFRARLIWTVLVRRQSGGGLGNVFFRLPKDDSTLCSVLTPEILSYQRACGWASRSRSSENDCKGCHNNAARVVAIYKSYTETRGNLKRQEIYLGEARADCMLLEPPELLSDFSFCRLVVHTGQYHFPFTDPANPTHSKWNHSMGHYARARQSKMESRQTELSSRTSGLSQPIIWPNETLPQVQYVGSFGSMGISNPLATGA